MKRKSSSLLKWSIGTTLAASVALAVGQATYFNRGGPYFVDRSFGTEVAVQQLMAHAQLLEREVLQQRKEIADLKKNLKESDEKAVKLEKRVRAMELRGK